jgi:hypothetical protein
MSDASNDEGIFMRFFSVEWLSLDDDAEVERVINDYNHLLVGLPGMVGQKIRDFCNAHSAHDALLDRLEVDLSSSIVQLDLVAGDNQAGHRLLRLRYANACIVGSSFEELADTLDRRSTVVRYDEFEALGCCIASQRYVHRFLLWPMARKEFGIEFGDFELTVKPIERRCFETYGQTFVVVQTSQGGAAGGS